METKSGIAFYLGTAFLILLILLHFLEPEFSPTWRLISEYEIGRYGILMRLAFFCWGGGFLFLLLSIWNLPDPKTGRTGKWWLLILSVVLFGAGIFKTQPITDPVRGITDIIHAVCGVVMIFTFPIASLLLSKTLSKTAIFHSSKSKLVWLTILVWLGFLISLVSLIIFNPGNRNYNSTVLIGWPNRIMVVCYTLWLFGVSGHIKNLGIKKDKRGQDARV